MQRNTQREAGERDVDFSQTTNGFETIQTNFCGIIYQNSYNEPEISNRPLIGSLQTERFPIKTGNHIELNT